MRALTVFTVLLGSLAFHQVGAASPCEYALGERPTSSAARICATKKLEGEEKRLRQLEKKIEAALSGDTGLRLTKDSFRKAQRDWKAYRGSNCWLEAFQVGEPTATQLACEALITACRTESLSALLEEIRGEASDFSITKFCQ